MNYFLESAHLTEVSRREYLGIIKYELRALKFFDINSTQALVIYNLGEDNDITIKEFIKKHYYHPETVLHNIQILVENEYIRREVSPYDKRSCKIKLSPMGITLYHKLQDSLRNKKYEDINEREFAREVVDAQLNLAQLKFLKLANGINSPAKEFSNYAPVRNKSILGLRTA